MRIPRSKEIVLFMKCHLVIILMFKEDLAIIRTENPFPPFIHFAENLLDHTTKTGIKVLLCSHSLRARISLSVGKGKKGTDIFLPIRSAFSIPKK